jgi:hypothetical protein
MAAWKAGLFEVQDEGSQLIALSTEAVPGMYVLPMHVLVLTIHMCVRLNVYIYGNTQSRSAEPAYPLSL